MTYNDLIIDFHFDIEPMKKTMMAIGLWSSSQSQNCIFGVSVISLSVFWLLSTKTYTEWNPEYIIQYLLNAQLGHVIVTMIIAKWKRKEFVEIIAEMEYNWRRLQFLSIEKKEIVFEYTKKARNIIKFWVICMFAFGLRMLMNIFILFYLLNS
uniref:Uncharacterized protein n=1 Tax=Bracon brevicornis TaxID=1563983 RepID=A0A6V7HQ05_9HYME